MAHGTNQTMTRSNAARRDSIPGIGERLVMLFDRLATWSERRRQRRALEALPDHLLADIGISRADAATEAEKPFWRG
ncbi:DUF1127 domain-containing protein [Azospirillum picis]|uniref:Uncharacterized protein YjiS (DUF1127 family) n=1 Tax=Azospirillum picis TaxID=488438 RepID=A0ABU0MGK0_9PROT|nr:DUF1127 domain-containing protein [Azospirillum picis]MBP2298393.1 uncharacterized protein YjiS (DUF1127 family) [Azospirillum picis]MDQ0532558.1 uncharacterized protein YjiS (DUF1127 family) [Azospirillum picis]